MLKRSLFAAALLASAGSAQAATTFTFAPGASSPAPGQTVIYNFSTTVPTISGSNFQILSPPASSSGAPPAFASPGGAYLSVLAGGSALINLFGASSFSFDWGSVDSYNFLDIIATNPADNLTISGNTVAPPANGNQGLAATNGRLTVTGTAGTTFTGFRLRSTQNSFEIDNVAAVPEPATWAMLIFGFGAIGTVLRRSHKAAPRVRFAI